MLTVYILLLFGVPSNVSIGPLGSLGKPALLWGVLLMLWWLLVQLQARSLDIRSVWQPVRVFYGALLVIVLISFAAAMLRGQPYDQVSPAVTAVVRMLSWGGVLLVAADGVRTHNDIVALIRRIVIVGAAMAALGLLQFFSGSTLLDWLGQIPSVTVELGGVDSRGAFTRAAGTATHPLEFTAALCGILPIAICTAIAAGYRSGTTNTRRLAWWLPVGLIAVISLLSVSRSAMIGVVAAVLMSLPALPRAYRWVIGVGGLSAVVGLVAVTPGLLGTVISLFADAGTDPSALSRTNALARVPEFIASSPVIGQGFGTFLPRYYIFDNEWVLLTVELGVLGVLVMVGLVGSGIWSSTIGARISPYTETKMLGRTVTASLVTMAALFLFFDGLSFAISAGLFFLMLGLSASIRTIGTSDARLVGGEPVG